MLRKCNLRAINIARMHNDGPQITVLFIDIDVLLTL